MDNKNTFKSLNSVANKILNRDLMDEYKLRLRKDSVDIDSIADSLKTKEGQEIHIIKKPVQTEELKRIQERLNKYYKDKSKE